MAFVLGDVFRGDFCTLWAVILV